MYCPSCGKKTFREDRQKKFQCTACTFTFYWNVAAAVAVIIRYREQVLFTIRAREPGKGLLDLPGGFVDPQETLEDVARREIREELRLELGNLRYLFSLPNLYPYRDVQYHTIDTFFETRLEQVPPIVAADDVIGFEWKCIEDVPLDKIALPSIKECIKKLRGGS